MPEKTADSDYTVFGTLKVQGAAPLPEVVDVVVAGGGPAGTAAAVRAKEYGLSCLVIDYDDLMKRIRDYPKEKLIKPNYGGGDKLQFPAGGPMLQALHFDDIDKDQMVAAWKGLYKDFAISAKIGAEFTGLARFDDGTWDVKAWSHRAGKEVHYRARHVIIAMGAGVPRRFDIPGNTDGLAFRLDNAADYVGAPALVIGGGTSAAEAVIAISAAKADANDPTPVYWSYRGDRLPKVSKALSEVFFDAYVGNGNIRYLAFSEPVAVVTAPDKNEYLSVRIDRKIVESRPAETTHLEFPKSQVVACIGEDLPVRFLQGLGVKIPTVNERPLMLVNTLGEVSLPNVFLVGDARGPKFLRCTDFNDSNTYEQVIQKRNIKAAMVEAVHAVETIATRLGKEAQRVVVEIPPAPQITPPAPSEPVDAQRRDFESQLVSLHPDGSEDEHFPFSKDTFTIGKSAADLTCADDVYMADLHARIVQRAGQYFVEDSGAGSGVWIRAQGGCGRPVAANDIAWIGAQIVMVLEEGGRLGLAHYNSDGVYQATYPIGDRGVIVGRGSEVPLDASDMSMSRRHVQFRVEEGALKAFDLGSKNGTYIKVNGQMALAHGDELRIASKRFRFETFAPVAKLAAADVIAEAVVEAPPQAAVATAPADPSSASPSPALSVAEPAPQAVANVPAGMHAVTIEHAEFPATFAVAPGNDLLHAYFDNLKVRFPECKVSKKGEPTEHQDEPLGWECKVGLCGLCAVQIVAGAENFEPVDPGKPEMKTIANVAGLDDDPNKHRLACLAKIKGPVRITMPS